MSNINEKLAIKEDVTVLRIDEEKLMEIDDINKSVFDTLPYGTNIVDEEGNILFMSKEFTKVFGNEAIGQKCWNIYKDNKKKCKMCPLGNDIKSNVKRIEAEGVLGGKSFYITHTNIIYKGKNALLETFTDITDLKYSERKLRSLYEDLEQLLLNMPSIIIKLTNDFKVSKWNNAAESYLGITAADVINTPFRECNIQWNWNEMIKKISLCKDTKSITKMENFRYIQTSGSDGFLGITIISMNNEDNEQVGILLMMKDVTEPKNIEQLIHSSKLEAIGALAAGIAHEINTPIQFISNNTVFLQDAFNKVATILNNYTHLLDMNKTGSVTPELLNEVDVMTRDIKVGYLVEEIPMAIKESQDGLSRVSDIVQSMKTFSHPDNEGQTLVDINKMVKSTITVARNEWKYVADMETDLDADLPLVPCYPGEFNQVILNLIINAAHSIDEVSGNGDLDRGKIEVSTLHDGDYAEIRISDTGTGIPDKIRTRIFDPFFTTKDVGKGTGQGLAIAHSVVVTKHKGEITFDTEVGRGTTFIIRLPILTLLENGETHEEADTLC